MEQHHTTNHGARWYHRMCHILDRSNVAIGFAALSGVIVAVCILLVILPNIVQWLIVFVPTIQPTWENGILSSLLTILLVCPFTIGYGFLLLSVGFIYGWNGFPILYFSSVSGSWIWFALTRKISTRWNINSTIWLYVQEYLPSIRDHSLRISSLSKTFDLHGLKVCSLLQLSFLPFGILNTLLALQPNVKFFPDFLVSTLVSRIKILNYIWIATTLKDITEVMDSSKRKFDWHDALMIGRSIIFSLLSILAIGYYARRELERMKLEQLQESMTTETQGDGTGRQKDETSAASDSNIELTVISESVDRVVSRNGYLRVDQDVSIETVEGSPSKDDDSDFISRAGE